HVAVCKVDDTTYFVVSFMNGAPGSSSAVRTDQAGSNISYVFRPSRIASQPPIAPAIASPIFGSNPYSNVQDGLSITPSRLMNSCTLIFPITTSSQEIDEATQPDSSHARAIARMLWPA